MSEPIAPESDVLSRLLSDRASIARVVGLGLAIVCVFLPASSRTGYDIKSNFQMLDVSPVAVAVPIMAAVALIIPAIPAMNPFSRLADLAVAVVGLIVSVMAFSSYTESVDVVGGFGSLIGGLPKDAEFGAALEIGAWLMFAVTALFALLGLRGMLKRRVTNANV